MSEAVLQIPVETSYKKYLTHCPLQVSYHHPVEKIMVVPKIYHEAHDNEYSNLINIPRQ